MAQHKLTGECQDLCVNYLVLAIFLVLTAHSSNAKALPCSA